ncbi:MULTISPECIES: hypothetical protein [Xanthomonas]|uniref:hypothetical protein n=1 Tax=Xanthomonas TaxID=338 RepID=UPI001ADAF296|nr:hypothetical protein [Xanthomonas phaseoli]MBO9766523.1 hypothetical protein [Xanthomonas phaseoli pv. dieffenbachiae]MBO9776132.1 hypothetical protein [Xanthomonas phaseoli pv. dieffenbachiae]MBO9778270.1 hypothetical protein [Xanthomonas phaseoli pv. dieffenbachiae]MBO9795342.1 hypothetical protein [Xanthomonas phaseoli pv. dieffenbachiae]MBO9801463.1 hypothetical protein [Xanthomonas phaseoli pv. dieffenbachiae]
MALQVIDQTTIYPNGDIGDDAYIAFSKINSMFSEVYASIDQLPKLYRSVGQNLLINSDFRVNQRNFGGGALAAGAFGYDRMFAAPGGCNVSVNQSTGVITHTSGTWCQAIEAPRDAFGKTLCIAVDDLSGGNLTVDVGGVASAITPGAGRRYVNLVAPVGSNTGNLLVKFTAASATYRNLAIVRGADFVGFQYRSPGEQAALCQWYAAAGNLFMRGATSQQTGVGLYVAAAMRAAPAVTFSNVSYVYGCSGIGSNAYKSGVEVFVNANQAFAFGAGYFFDAEITS